MFTIILGAKSTLKLSNVLTAFSIKRLTISPLINGAINKLLQRSERGGEVVKERGREGVHLLLQKLG